uniref:SWIM-type domain-containing protein n=1 Tax=Loa loa TaxID=7209 RepID=A0A1I7VM28_LOALO
MIVREQLEQGNAQDIHCSNYQNDSDVPVYPCPCGASSAFLEKCWLVVQDVAKQDCHLQDRSRAISVLNRLHARLDPPRPVHRLLVVKGF